MKSRFICTLSCLLVAALLCLTFASCASSPTATVRVENGDKVETFTVKLSDYKDGAMLYDVLSTTDDLHAEMDESDPDSPFVTAICGVTPNPAKNEFVAMYSSLSGEAYAFGEAAFELDGVSFYYTAVGVADLPLLEGETYIFRLESWS
ncbi:MAG: hypothetical protein IKA05_00765 [Clostridia bacterium]|nr:hypothetical protein [Clostridia bacterium]